jgi:hypothetical protein
MNDEHVFALVETINGAHLYAIHQLALDAAFIDDICQISSSFWGGLSAAASAACYHWLLYEDIATDAVRILSELLFD